MNNKGFTLVELIATIVILALVMGIASYAITAIIENSKIKNYDYLITNIKDAAETYYHECKYSKESLLKTFNNDEDARDIFCDYNVNLGELVQYGYLKGNSKDSDDKFTLVDPRNDNNISDCQISISFTNGKIVVVNNSGDACPSYS